jgi:uncharacterized protein
MKRILSLFVVCFGFIAVLSAQDFPEQPNPPRLVNDFANVLSPEEEQSLERKLVAFDDTTSTQIAIVTITDLGPYEIADYSYRLFEKWGIGRAEKNNGALILVAIENRKVWITTGYGLEATLTDALSKRIVENSLKPAFKAGAYAAGLEAASNDIMMVVTGEYKAEPKKKRGRGISAGLIVVFIIFVLIMLSRINQIKRNHMGSSLDLFTLLMLLNSGGRGGGGGGGFGDFSSGGGGFGGFGGGSSGGGGAGGSW